MNYVGSIYSGRQTFKNKEQSIRTIHKALEEGVTIFNTGDFYCKGESQVVLGEALKGIPRDKYFVSLKFGISFTENGIGRFA